jgi:hypothetical protein
VVRDHGQLAAVSGVSGVLTLGIDQNECVALGLKARTGRAILVAIGGAEPARVLQRTELKLLPAGDFAPYHAAEGHTSAEAQKHVDRSVAAAHRLAEEGIRKAIETLSGCGHNVCGCGVLVGGSMPPWSTDEILAVHVRMHQAEGVLFRDVLVAGARACGFVPTTLREKAALDEAAFILGLKRADLETRLVALGKTVGAPWGKDRRSGCSCTRCIECKDAGFHADA